MEIQNSVVGVTGGRSGIGRAVAGAGAAKGLKRWVPTEGLQASAVLIGSIPYARTRTEEPT